MLTDHPPDPGSPGEKLSDCSLSPRADSAVREGDIRQYYSARQSTKGAQLSTTNSD